MIRALLVDDEEPARMRLRRLLDEHEDVEIVAEASDGEEALARVTERRPDVVFLDIHMPGLDGMQVASALKPPRPHVVFCTAFDQYAVDAFEHHAMAYLLKPLARARLSRVLERIRSSIDEQRGRDSCLDEAVRAQSRLLPQSLPPMRRLDYDGICQPSEGVGGDFYDFFPVGGRQLAIALGDVAGKGIGAGILMASLQARVQSLAQRWGRRLGPMFEELDRLLHQTTEANRYATLCYAVYDDESGTMTYVNAGHLPPIVLRGSREAASLRLEVSGPPLGALGDARYECRRIELVEGDVLVLFSDGVTEAEDPAGRQFGTSGVEAAIAACRSAGAAELQRSILAALDRHLDGGARTDDVTVVVARYGRNADESPAR